MNGFVNAKNHDRRKRLLAGLGENGGIPEPQEGYSGFQVMGMIKGFFGVSNFLFRDFFGYENLASICWGSLI